MTWGRLLKDALNHAEQLAPPNRGCPPSGELLISNRLSQNSLMMPSSIDTFASSCTIGSCQRLAEDSSNSSL